MKKFMPYAILLLGCLVSPATASHCVPKNNELSARVVKDYKTADVGGCANYHDALEADQELLELAKRADCYHGTHIKDQPQIIKNNEEQVAYAKMMIGKYCNDK